jgi:beta-ketoacyl-acyl-carrier-protein synthase II
MELLRNGRPRVVITGMGAITALGGVTSLWENLKSGISGIRRLETINVEHVPIKIGAEVRGFDQAAVPYVEYKEARRMGRSSLFAIATAKSALDDAGISNEDIESEAERYGTVIGTSMGPHEMAEQATHKYRASNFKYPNPLGLIQSLPNMPSHHVSKIFQTLGPLNTPANACASGTQAVGEASELIRNGRADVIITGGVDALLQDYTLAGFNAMDALVRGYEDKPDKASRPFDKNRSGFILGEGCALFVIESLNHALKRGARIYAEVLGHASSSDAYHVAAVDPEGRGAVRSMKWALEDAHINSDEIDYINPHGSSTPSNDAMETLAIKKLFGEHAYNIPISSTKSMLGHALGASGAIEILASVKTLVDQIIHPTINYETPDPDCDLDYVPNVAREVSGVKTVLSNSFGLGGQNASIVIASM